MGHGTVIPAATGSAAPELADRALGAILIESGRLAAADVQRVLEHARQKRLRFGDAAVELGILSRSDIDLALASQFRYPYLERGQTTVSEDLVAAYQPFSAQVEAFRTLRNQLLQRWFDSDPSHKALAIVSAERGEGRSHIAANLAVVFSQMGARTLLVDADMRHPSLHRVFGVENATGLSAVLSGRGGSDAAKRFPQLGSLSLLPVGAPPPNPSELLVRPSFGRFLEQMASEFDVVLLDTPAASEFSDAQTICVRAGAGLIVVRRNATRVWQVRGIADGAAMGTATLVGTVLNEH